MDGIKVLERIIQEEGSCTWAKPKHCAVCPIGRFARERSGFMSCVEALAIDGLSEEEADVRYKAAAQERLADISIDDIIREE